MHIGRIHRDHRIEAAHELQLLPQTAQRVGDEDDTGEAVVPFLADGVHFARRTKDKQARTGALLQDECQRLSEFSGGVNLSAMRRKGSHAEEVFGLSPRP